MSFFKRNEKTLVKSLIYGFVGGLFYAILFIPVTKTITNGSVNTFQKSTTLQYIIDVLQSSIIISLITLIVTFTFLLLKQKNKT